MSVLTICSWNVNGLRATLKTGDFQRWLEATRPDIAGFQEVKATPAQVPEHPWEPLGYRATWNPAERPGYSGALFLTQVEPDRITPGLGIEEFDGEGRMIEAEYGDLVVITCYFPNGGRKLERLPFKLRFYEAFLAHVDALRARGKGVIFMGDLNVAHHEIDLARPNEARNGTGFLPEERAWVNLLLARGYVDTFRAANPGLEGAYTYWDAWRQRRERNIGWRIDYVMVSEELLPRVSRAFIQSEVMGSDHCPVGIELQI